MSSPAPKKSHNYQGWGKYPSTHSFPKASAPYSNPFRYISITSFEVEIRGDQQIIHMSEHKDICFQKSVRNILQAPSPDPNPFPKKLNMFYGYIFSFVISLLDSPHSPTTISTPPFCVMGQATIKPEQSGLIHTMKHHLADEEHVYAH